MEARSPSRSRHCALLGMDAYLTGQWDEVQKLTDEGRSTL